MKSLIVIILFTLSLNAMAQFRTVAGQASGSVTVALNGSRNCVVGGGYEITTPQNSQAIGQTLCRIAGLMFYEAHTALPGGTYRNTAADVDPATATCRLEGTISATTITGYTCGVDP